MDRPQIGGQEEESLQKLRSALATPHGTSSEKRERILSAWSSLRNVTHPIEEGAERSKGHRKRTKYEDGSKGSAEKKPRVEDSAKSSRSFLKEEQYKLLHDAARMGRADRIRELAESGIKITARDNSGFTALHWASLYGHTEGVRALLGLGASDGKRVNRQTDTGNTALHLACTGRHAEVAALLQLYKADEYKANLCGQTPVSLGLRDLVASISRNQRLDATQKRRESTRRSQLHEISDWHVRRDINSSATTSSTKSQTGTNETREKPLRGSLSTWDDYDTAWKAFLSKFTCLSAKKDGGTSSTSMHTVEDVDGSDGTIHFHDVPWPVTGLQIVHERPKADNRNQGQERLLLAELGASGATLRFLIQQERLRWHPDKFLQVFGRHLSSADRNAVLAGVQTIIQLLNALADEAEDEII